MESVKKIQFFILSLLLTCSATSMLSANANSVRSLKTGDTFTPEEMLPVAIKLLEKVPDHGSGKGIVSSSKNAEDLADKLFEAFFMSSNRIMTLTEFDIKGLDALQALALSGEVAGELNEEVATEASNPMTEMLLKGQLVQMPMDAYKCKYKLLNKRIDDGINVKRRGIPLAKKLNKKRRLIIKSRRGVKENLRDPSLCRWRYECSKPGDLDSCQLHAQCNNDKMTTANYIGKQTKSKAEMKLLSNFRKLVGLSVVDEEVEKILETRVIQLRPNNMEENERVESLGEYFFNIIMAQSAVASTTEMATTVAIDITPVNTQSEENNEPTENIITEENIENVTSQDISEVMNPSRIRRTF